MVTFVSGLEKTRVSWLCNVPLVAHKTLLRRSSWSGTSTLLNSIGRYTDATCGLKPDHFSFTASLLTRKWPIAEEDTWTLNYNMFFIFFQPSRRRLSTLRKASAGLKNENCCPCSITWSLTRDSSASNTWRIIAWGRRRRHDKTSDNYWEKSYYKSL